MAGTGAAGGGLGAVDDGVTALACSMPKAELHLHIEGALEPDLAFALARRNRISLPWADEAALTAAKDFQDLQSFLDLYYACAAVLRTPEDFRDLMLAYLRRAAADGVVHAEIFFDPQTHTERGVAYPVVLEGLREGMALGERELGVTSGLILCFLRHLTEAQGFLALDAALGSLDLIDGFGLDSGERGNPPGKFQRLFERCRALGKPVVAHAAEEGPPSYITEALDLLKVRRIDHGVRAVEDPAVLARLAREGIALTVCPLSNLRLRVFPHMAAHTLPGLLAAGVRATINSDDPAYFGGYLNDNIRAVQRAFDFPPRTWYQLARNSFEAAFAPEARRLQWIAALDAHFRAAGADPQGFPR